MTVVDPDLQYLYERREELAWNLGLPLAMNDDELAARMRAQIAACDREIERLERLAEGTAA